MDKSEKILIVCAALVVAALLLWSYDPRIVAQSSNDEPDQPSDAVIPKTSYLTYNQPYMFAPPVANLLPTITNGMLGQPSENPPTGNYTAVADCGC